MTGDDPQRAAATSEQANLLVVAPPGCGKTEFLALRAEALIPRLRPNQRILALTFTNRAKANLGQRLRQSLGQERCRRAVSVHNFHGHATEIILAHGATLGLRPADLQLPTSKSLKRALEPLNLGYDSAAVADRLAELKRNPISDDELLAALAGPGDELALRVERERIEGNQLFYEDLLRHAQRLLLVDEIANLYQQHYGAVLVDEFQDLSLQQLDIARRTCTTSQTFAGDPLQGIYSWAGAAPQEVEASLRKLSGEPIQLAVSYRSSPAVLAMVNAISGRMGATPLRSHDPEAWPGQGAAAAIVLDSYQAEAAFIADASQQIVRADPQASIGIIVRSGWRRREINTAFAERADIPCRRWDLAIEDPAVLERLRRVVAGLPRNVSFEAAQAATLAEIDPSDVDTIEQVQDAFGQLQESSTGTVRAALNQFRVRSDDAPVDPGVHLLNAHTGKGQQFDWVFVPGLEEKHLPDRRSMSGPSLDEEERVLLVMLSRARRGLVVTRSSTAQYLSGDFYQPQRSRWWNDLSAAATVNRVGFQEHLDTFYTSPV